MALLNEHIGSCEAFLAAWREHERVDRDPMVDSDTREYQYAMFAYGGGLDRMARAHLSGNTEAALAALVAISNIDLLVAGFYSVGAEVDPDVAAELRGIRTTLTNLWRFHDCSGADPSTREYARYVEAPEKHDLVRWEQERK